MSDSGDPEGPDAPDSTAMIPSRQSPIGMESPDHRHHHHHHHHHHHNHHFAGGPSFALARSNSGLSTTTAPETTPQRSDDSLTSTGSVEVKPNHVRTVMLNGVPIVSLIIDGKERLCLAQISNTLLKTFSYNEIHNRRVALGITCVQCTPVQLEILRRAGAMPISSRRCGMITKREAERLCKSFLAESAPPKLPEHFSFECEHDCAWGCRGSFLPSRYNSSRAKCIKCAFCNMFFSPNKFIFHSHRLPESKYVQPDAANFNSWRRHLRLCGTPPEEVLYAWEDVKAMFNGGSRKRVMSATYSRFQSTKRPRSDVPCPPSATSEGLQNVVDKGLPYVPLLSYSPVGHAPKSFDGGLCVAPTHSYAPRGTAPPCVGFPPTVPQGSIDKSLTPMSDLRGPPSFVDYVWAGKAGSTSALTNSAAYGLLWPRRPGASSPMAVDIKLNSTRFYDKGLREDTSDSSRGNCDSEAETPVARRSMSSCSEQDFRSSDNDDAVSVCPSGRRSKDSGFFGSLRRDTGGDKTSGHCSAFRPVLRSGPSLTTHSVASLMRPCSSGVNKSETTTTPMSVSALPLRHDQYLVASSPYGMTTSECFRGGHKSDLSSVCKDCSDNSNSKSGESDNAIDVEMTDESKDGDKLSASSANNVPTSPIRSETPKESSQGENEAKVRCSVVTRAWTNDAPLVTTSGSLLHPLAPDWKAEPPGEDPLTAGQVRSPFSVSASIRK